MLDTEGNVAEGSGENFFMVKDAKIFTPDAVSYTHLTLPTIFRV